MRTLALLLILLSLPAAAQTRAVDGDTIEDAGTRYRLWGMDAPESAQTCQRDGQVWACGQEATAMLAKLLSGRPVCEFKALDRYGRTVALCRVAGADLSAAMVEAGMARAFVRYSRDYLPEEARARDAKRGIWAGEHVAPWDWRAQKAGKR